MNKEEARHFLNHHRLWDLNGDDRLIEYNANKDEFLLALIKYTYPGHDLAKEQKQENKEEIDYLGTIDEWVDTFSLFIACEKAVEYYDASKGKSFVNFYHDLLTETQRENFIKESDSNITRTVVDISKMIKKIRANDNRLSYNEIISILKQDDKYKTTKEETWEKVIHYLNGGTYKRLYKIDENNEGELIDIDISVCESGYETEFAIENIIDTLIIDIEKLESAQDTVYFKLFCTRAFLYWLKGEESHDTYKKPPAGNFDHYELLHKHENRIYCEIWHQGYTESVINESPEDIKTLYGAYYNLVKKKLNNESIRDYMNVSAPFISKKKKILEKFNNQSFI